MNMQIVYESKSPSFAIGRDSFQWILCKRIRKGGIGWEKSTFHPTLSDLLSELSEVYFRKFTKKVKVLKELNGSIDKVYKLISEVGVGLQEVI